MNRRVTFGRKEAAEAQAVAAVSAAVAGAAAALARISLQAIGGQKSVSGGRIRFLPAIASMQMQMIATNRAICARFKRVYSSTKRGQERHMTIVNGNAAITR
jgi:hypothetical protein